MVRSEKEFEEMIGRLKIDAEPNPQHREKLREQMIATFEAAANPEQSTFAKGRFKMNRLMKIAAAILIVVAIGAGVMWFAERTASIAWADVGTVVERARTICFTMINHDRFD